MRSFYTLSSVICGVKRNLVVSGRERSECTSDKHGPLDKRFGASVRNEIAKIIQKAQNRRRYLPSVPLASFDRATHQDQSQAFMRDEIMEKIGKLGVAVFACVLAGVCPSILVGRVEFGSPSLYRIKKLKRTAKISRLLVVRFAKFKVLS